MIVGRLNEASMATLPVVDFTDHPMPRGPWLRGDPVTIEEHPTPGSRLVPAHKLPSGTVVVLSPPSERLASGMLALIVLWRAVADPTRACAACGFDSSIHPERP